LTLAIVQFLINLLTAPFLGIIQGIFGHTDWFGKLTDPSHAVFVSKLLILILLPVIIIGIGVLGRMLIINKIFDSIDSMVNRLPGINGIYRSIKEAVNALLKPAESDYSRVVLIPFAHAGSYCIGFITKEEKDLDRSSAPPQNITVFIPATPNPTAGFMQLTQRDQLIYLDMSVEEAVKYLLSCGIISNDFKRESTKF